MLEEVTYEYNLQNRLAKVTTVDYVAATTTVVAYKYNCQGIRVTKIEDPDGAPVVTEYLVDAYNHTGYAQTFEETTGASTTAYIIGDDVLAQATGTGETDIEYLLYDGHGSTRQMADDGGQITDAFSYDAYGVMLGGNPQTPAATNLLYAGEQFDTDAQQYYLRARFYNPLTGLFNRMDPYEGNIQDPQSLHKYLYCHANPVNSVDPSGELGLVATIAICMFVFLAVFVTVDFLRMALTTHKPSADDQRAVNTAINNAKNFVQKSLTKIARMNPTDVVEYIKWFGTRDPNRESRVKKCFEKVKSYLDNGFNWYKTNQPYYGHCDVFGRIFFDMYFWTAPAIATSANPDSQAGTVIHELTHKAGMTKDYKYGVYDCKNLASTSPKKAVKNADNYAYYAEAIP